MLNIKFIKYRIIRFSRWIVNTIIVTQLTINSIKSNGHHINVCCRWIIIGNMAWSSIDRHWMPNNPYPFVGNHFVFFIDENQKEINAFRFCSDTTSFDYHWWWDTTIKGHVSFKIKNIVKAYIIYRNRTTILFYNLEITKFNV